MVKPLLVIRFKRSSPNDLHFQTYSRISDTRVIPGEFGFSVEVGPVESILDNVEQRLYKGLNSSGINSSMKTIKGIYPFSPFKEVHYKWKEETKWVNGRNYFFKIQNNNFKIKKKNRLGYKTPPVSTKILEKLCCFKVNINKSPPTPIPPTHTLTTSPILTQWNISLSVETIEY
ncbi:hypothetical protein ACTA71_010402 [Dictyostelium dimigraforme]